MMNERQVAKTAEMMKDQHHAGMKLGARGREDAERRFSSDLVAIVTNAKMDGHLMREYVPKLQTIFDNHLEPQKPYKGEFRETIDTKGIAVKDVAEVARKFVEGAGFHFPAQMVQMNMISHLVGAVMAGRAEGAAAGLLDAKEKKEGKNPGARRQLEEGKRGADRAFLKASKGIQQAYPDITTEEMIAGFDALIKKARSEEFERAKTAALELQEKR